MLERRLIEWAGRRGQKWWGGGREVGERHLDILILVLLPHCLAKDMAKFGRSHHCRHHTQSVKKKEKKRSDFAL
jgi:hypothetical protein